MSDLCSKIELMTASASHMIASAVLRMTTRQLGQCLRLEEEAHKTHEIFTNLRSCSATVEGKIAAMRAAERRGNTTQSLWSGETVERQAAAVEGPL